MLIQYTTGEFKYSPVVWFFYFLFRYNLTISRTKGSRVISCSWNSKIEACRLSLNKSNTSSDLSVEYWVWILLFFYYFSHRMRKRKDKSIGDENGLENRRGRNTLRSSTLLPSAISLSELLIIYAGVVKLVDTRDLKSLANSIRVRFPSPVPYFFSSKKSCISTRISSCRRKGWIDPTSICHN